MKRMKVSEFAIKILGLKLNEHQKQFLDKPTKKQIIALGRGSGDRGLVYFAILAFHNRYIKGQNIPFT